MTGKEPFPSPIFSKALFTELQWKNAKCSNCGTELPKYSTYTEYGEYKTCKKCGNRHLLIRKLPQNLQGDKVI